MVDQVNASEEKMHARGGVSLANFAATMGAQGGRARSMTDAADDGVLADRTHNFFEAPDVFDSFLHGCGMKTASVCSLS